MNLAVFYHIKPGPPIDPINACRMFSQQMATYEASGLHQSASFSCIGINGGHEDFKRLIMGLPKGSEPIINGESARSELPTMHFMQEWVSKHPDWYVCYWHAKGVTHQPDRLHVNWRKCMERVVIQNWKQCVKDLDSGFDSVGAHWLTPERFPGIVKAPFWGGNFWWAKASFLMTLPPLRPNSECREQDFDAESWIGWGSRKPIVRDYAPHWPHADLCAGRPCYMTK